MTRPGKTLRLLLPTLAFALAACASNAPLAPSRDVGRAMDAWKGKPVTEAVAKWGMPDAIHREGTVGVLVWHADDTSDTASLPALPPGMAWADLCRRELTVDPSETIVQARAMGSGCSTDPWDYAPR